jgi:hypothetical protein
MLLKNVLKKAAAMVGLNVDFDAENAENDRDIALLVECANSVYAEIVTEYLPLVFEEEILFGEKGRAYYSAFSKPPVNIVSLKDAGVNAAYTVFHDHICAENAEGKKLTARYAFKPPEIDGIETELIFNPAVTERTAALGIAAEYSLVCGMFGESVLYDKRYKDSLRNAMRKKGEMKIPARKFI